jgi:probable F420-dependent oxidoreductase
MDYGFNLPTRGPLARPECIRAIAERGEALGYAYLAIPDHIVIPRRIGSRYPYTQSGEMPGAAGGDCLEQLTTMAWVAAFTSKARILTSVMVVPHRAAVLTAKALATIDVLSGGRLTVGCGVGWMAEEFAAIGAPPFGERGKVTDEFLRAFRELWTSDDPSFAGAYARFSDIDFAPKPVQDPHPPLWIGGESPPALRRAARFADCWYPIGSNPRHPLNTVDRYAAALDRLRRLAEENGRDPAAIGLAYWANWYVEDTVRRLDDGQRHLFTGNAEEVAEDIRRLRELGLRHLLFNFLRGSLGETLASIERFAGEVLPLVRA